MNLTQSNVRDQQDHDLPQHECESEETERSNIRRTIKRFFCPKFVPCHPPAYFAISDYQCDRSRLLSADHLYRVQLPPAPIGRQHQQNIGLHAPILEIPSGIGSVHSESHASPQVARDSPSLKRNEGAVAHLSNGSLRSTATSKALDDHRSSSGLGPSRK